MEQPKKCVAGWEFDTEKDWKLKLTGDCGDTMKEIEKLPSRRRRYLQRRIEVEED